MSRASVLRGTLLVLLSSVGAVDNVDCFLRGVWQAGNASITVREYDIVLTNVALPASLANTTSAEGSPISFSAWTENIDEAYRVFFQSSTDSSTTHCAYVQTIDGVLHMSTLGDTCPTSGDTELFAGIYVEGSNTSFCYWSIIGCLIAVVGSFCSTAGMNFQKIAHERLKAANKTNYLKHPVWLLGMVLIITDALLDIVMFGMAPASLLSPLSSVVLVHNIILAPCMLGEKLTRQAIIGTMFLVTGAVTASINASHETPLYPASYFHARWATLPMVLYVLGALALFGAVLTMARRTMSKYTVLHEPMAPMVHPPEPVDDEANALTAEALEGGLRIDTDPHTDVDAGANDSLETINEAFISECTLQVGTSAHTFCQFAFPFLAGLCGGQSVIFVKLVIELLKTSAFGEAGVTYLAFSDWHFYVYLLCMVVCLVGQVNLLNLGLKDFDSLQVIPVYITFYQVFGVVGGGIFYEEFAQFSTTQAGLFPLGIVISLCGIRILASRKSTEADTKLIGSPSGSRIFNFKDSAAITQERQSRLFAQSIFQPYFNQHTIKQAQSSLEDRRASRSSRANSRTGGSFLSRSRSGSMRSIASLYNTYLPTPSSKGKPSVASFDERAEEEVEV